MSLLERPYGEPRALSDVGRYNDPEMKCLEAALQAGVCELLLRVFLKISVICEIRSSFQGASKLTGISWKLVIF